MGRIAQLVKVCHNGELGWKLPKFFHYLSMYKRSIFCVRNKNIKELQVEEECYRRLCKEYGSYVDAYQFEQDEHHVNRTAWICWMQGEDEAPELVKACIRSIRNELKDFDVIILTEDNIGRYITLPEHVMRKYREGKITRTHFSDILRVAILCKHGGMWLDSTVFCTDGAFANRIIELPLFVYKVMNLDRNDEEPIMASSWLMSAMSNDPILLLTRDLLYKYWENHEYMIHFFLLHLLFAMSARKYREEWDRIPMYNNRSPHTLMFELGDLYNEDRWEEIKRLSDFHKLTRHTEYNQPNTFYQHVLAYK